jgi:hypothetical protein
VVEPLAGELTGSPISAAAGVGGADGVSINNESS